MPVIVPANSPGINVLTMADFKEPRAHLWNRTDAQNPVLRASGSRLQHTTDLNTHMPRQFVTGTEVEESIEFYGSWTGKKYPRTELPGEASKGK